MAWWGSSSRDGTLFIDCMRPVVKTCRNLPGPLKIAIPLVLVFGTVGVAVYVAKKKASQPKSP